MACESRLTKMLIAFFFFFCTFIRLEILREVNTCIQLLFKNYGIRFSYQLQTKPSQSRGKLGRFPHGGIFQMRLYA